MRILFCYPKFFPITGGGTVHGYYLAKYLHEYGNVITVINKQNDGFSKYVNKKNIFSFLKAIISNDIVYVRISTCGFANFIPLLAKLFGAKVVGEVNAPSEELYLHGKSKLNVLLSRYLLKFQLRFCSDIISVSEEVNQFLISLNHSSHIIYNGGERIKNIEKREIISKEWSANYRDIMLWSGNIYSWQGSDILNDIASKARELDIGIIIVTNKEFDMEFGQNVKVVINPKREELSDIYNICTIGLAPYDLSTLTRWGFYNSPLKIYEYLVNDLLVFTNATNCQISKIDDVNYFETVDSIFVMIQKKRKNKKIRHRTWNDVALETISVLENVK